MENVIFTISSNNYLDRALTLMQSIERQNMEVKVFIVLADKKNQNVDYDSLNVDFIYLDELPIDTLEEMQFKYDLVEFNTAIKPFVFKKLFSDGYKKVIYFDPDIYVYRKLDDLLELLDQYSIVLTPHKTCANMGQGIDCINEAELSLAGVFNLGFCAFANTDCGQQAIDWWCNKLRDYCFVDNRLGLFYDQKWMNFMPCYFPNDTKVLNEPGYNYAPWNYDEREVIVDESEYKMKDICGRESWLYFIHFSGFNPMNKDYVIQKHFTTIVLPNSMQELCHAYAQCLIENGHEKFKGIPYAFNCFDNGKQIAHLHRQIYRALCEDGKEYKGLFTCGKGSYYQLLSKSKLLYSSPEITNKKGVNDFDKKARKINKLLKLAKKLLGVEKYIMFMRYMGSASKLDKQTFLLKCDGKDKH